MNGKTKWGAHTEMICSPKKEGRSNEVWESEWNKCVQEDKQQWFHLPLIVQSVNTEHRRVDTRSWGPRNGSEHGESIEFQFGKTKLRVESCSCCVIIWAHFIRSCFTLKHCGDGTKQPQSIRAWSFLPALSEFFVSNHHTTVKMWAERTQTRSHFSFLVCH